MLHVSNADRRRGDPDAQGRQTGSDSHLPDGAEWLTPMHVLARLAGYDTRVLLGLPFDVLRSAAGCGTPVAVSDLLPGELVLVLGPGPDLDLLLAASRVGPAGRVFGVAWDEASLMRIRSNAGAAGYDNVEILPGERAGLPVGDGAVDWLIGNRMIGFCPDGTRLFAEIHRVLKPGGRLYWADIVAEGLPTWVRVGVSSATSWLAAAPGESEYLAGLADAGLEDVRNRGRYVYTAEELGAVAESMGAAEDVAPVAARLAAEVVGGVWRAYFSARKPLLRTQDGQEDEQPDQQEDDEEESR